MLPGRVPGPGNSTQAAHLDVSVFARGLMRRLVTRVYFVDTPGLADDPVPGLVPPGHRDTLLARTDDGVNGRWSIRLRGDDAIAFFEV